MPATRRTSDHSKAVREPEQSYPSSMVANSAATSANVSPRRSPADTKQTVTGGSVVGPINLLADVALGFTAPGSGLSVVSSNNPAAADSRRRKQNNLPPISTALAQQQAGWAVGQQPIDARSHQRTSYHPSDWRHPSYHPQLVSVTPRHPPQYHYQEAPSFVHSAPLVQEFPHRNDGHLGPQSHPLPSPGFLHAQYDGTGPYWAIDPMLHNQYDRRPISGPGGHPFEQHKHTSRRAHSAEALRIADTSPIPASRPMIIEPDPYGPPTPRVIQGRKASKSDEKSPPFEDGSASDTNSLSDAGSDDETNPTEDEYVPGKRPRSGRPPKAQPSGKRASQRLRKRQQSSDIEDLLEVDAADAPPKKRNYVRRDAQRRKEQNAQAQKKFRWKKKVMAEQMRTDLEDQRRLVDELRERCATLQGMLSEKDHLLDQVYAENGRLKRRLEQCGCDG